MIAVSPNAFETLDRFGPGSTRTGLPALTFHDSRFERLF